jgi:hypothetical protein
MQGLINGETLAGGQPPGRLVSDQKNPFLVIFEIYIYGKISVFTNKKI